MTIETQSTVDAGWYPDPAGTTALRWWNGVSWTDHLQQPAPQAPAASSVPAWTPEQQYALATEQKQQVEREQAYVPFAHSASHQSALPYDSAVVAPAQNISNRSGWLSLGLGALGLILVVVHLESTRSGIYVTSAVLTSIIWGIRALVRRHNGQSTLLWAPIVGMSLGVIASIITVMGLMGVMGTSQYGTSQYGTGVTSTGTISSGTTELLSGNDEPKVFANNPTLTREQVVLSQFAAKMGETYNHGSQIGPTTVWPTILKQNADGTITDLHKKVIMTIPTSTTFEYDWSQYGWTARLYPAGSLGKEMAQYGNYQNRVTYSVACLTTDTTCS